MAGQPRELMGCGEPRQHARPRRVQGAGAAHVHVDAGVGRGRLDVERLVLRRERLRDRPGGGNGAIERRRQHRAAVDPDDVMRAERGEADFDDVRACRAGHGTWRGGGRRRGRRSTRPPVHRGRLARARRRPGCVSNLDSGPGSNAGSRSRRRCRNAGRTARCAPGSRSRPAADGGDPDGRERSRPRRSRPAACRARRRGPAGVSATPSPRWATRSMASRSVNGNGVRRAGRPRSWRRPCRAPRTPS